MPRHSKERSYGSGMTDCFGDERFGDEHKKGFSQFMKSRRDEKLYRREYQTFAKENQQMEGNRRTRFQNGSTRSANFDHGGSNFESTGRKGGRRGDGPRHPPHLKGKQIGLWYAKLNKTNRNGSHNERLLHLSKTEFQRISKLLKFYGKDLNLSEVGKRIFSAETMNQGTCSDCGNSGDAESSISGSDFDESYDQAAASPNVEVEEKFDVEAVELGQTLRSTEEPSCSYHTVGASSEFASQLDKLSQRKFEIEDVSGIKLEPDEFKYMAMDDDLEEFNTTLEFCEQDSEIVAQCPTLVHDKALDIQLKNEFLLTQQSPKYQKMLDFRSKLPVYAMKEDILRKIRDNQVIVLSGETGSGKTTQVPQFILDDLILNDSGSTANIVTTQPRRISAISVAQRVAEERGENLGNSVGYQIRLEKVLPAKGRGSILFCTTGIILQWMLHNPTLNGYSHVILDEVHERDIQSDVLITLIKDILPHRPSLKVILMSATMNADEFSVYFDNCATINVPGRLFPVETIYLEDLLERIQIRLEPKTLEYLERQNAKLIRERSGYNMSRREKNEMLFLSEERINNWLKRISNRYSRHTLDILRALGEHCEVPAELIASVIDYIINNSTDGAVLVFVPGSGMITKVIKEIRKLHPRYSEQGGSCRIYPLHSMLSTLNQKEVFEVPQEGHRKVIVSTNIAETSITIEDVVYVVDCGRIKMTNFDSSLNTTSLLPVLVSKANAAQRTGRAGRVRPGQCWRLFSRFQEITMLDSLPPEIMRTRLENVILTIKLLGQDHIEEFLSKCMNSPEPQLVAQSVRFLKSIQALHEDDESLTPLGRHLAHLPMDPQCAKMLLLGALFSCLDPILTIAATLSFKDPFYIPIESRHVADAMKAQLSNGSQSDHILLIRAVEGFEDSYSVRKHHDFCYKYFISESNMWHILKLKKDYARMLHECGYISNTNPKNIEANANSSNMALIRALICGGLYPNIVEATTKKSDPKSLATFKFRSEPGESNVSIMPSSVTCNEKFSSNVWLTFFKKMRVNDAKNSLMFDVTVLGPRPVVFFGGHLKVIRDRGVDYLTVDDWIRFQTNLNVAQRIMGLRALLNLVLSDKVELNGCNRWRLSSRESAILNTIVDLLSVDDIRPTC